MGKKSVAAMRMMQYKRTHFMISYVFCHMHAKWLRRIGFQHFCCGCVFFLSLSRSYPVRQSVPFPDLNYVREEYTPFFSYKHMHMCTVQLKTLEMEMQCGAVQCKATIEQKGKNTHTHMKRKAKLRMTRNDGFCRFLSVVIVVCFHSGASDSECIVYVNAPKSNRMCRQAEAQAHHQMISKRHIFFNSTAVFQSFSSYLYTEIKKKGKENNNQSSAEEERAFLFQYFWLLLLQPAVLFYNTTMVFYHRINATTYILWILGFVFVGARTK